MAQTLDVGMLIDWVGCELAIVVAIVGVVGGGRDQYKAYNTEKFVKRCCCDKRCACTVSVYS